MDTPVTTDPAASGLPAAVTGTLTLGTVGGFRAHVLTTTARVFDVPPAPTHVVDINIGAPTRLLSRRDGHTHRDVHAAGNIDIVPAGVAAYWEAEGESVRADLLLLSLPPAFLRGVAARSGFDPDRIALVNRFGARDPQIEHIGLALVAEMRAGHPSGPLYSEGLATALGVRLLTSHNACRLQSLPAQVGGLAPADLRRALDHIHDHLDADLSLAGIAGLVHLSPSHFTRLFRRATGMAPHQYVIARRVEEAERLLRRGGLSVGEVAARVGFASQSHLNRHFKRRLGVPPTALTPRNGANMQNSGANVEAGRPAALP